MQTQNNRQKEMVKIYFTRNPDIKHKPKTRTKYSYTAAMSGIKQVASIGQTVQWAEDGTVGASDLQ